MQLLDLHTFSNVTGAVVVILYQYFSPGLIENLNRKCGSADIENIFF